MTASVTVDRLEERLSLAEIDRPKVLVVDDDPLNRSLLRVVLAPTCSVLEAESGPEALDLIARSEPDVVLLDEPTSHLDFRSQALTLKMIGALAAQGMTMIMTTHDPNHAFLFAGRVALMKQGRFIAVGTASEVITDATLKATYRIDVAVFSVPRGAGLAERKFCSPWLT